MIGSAYFDSESISPPADFAFQPPHEHKVPPSESVAPSFVPYTLSLSTRGHKNVSSATGPFTMSGTVTPVELSVDTSSNRISREFAIPSSADGRRPASSLHHHHSNNRRDEDSNGFHNPFASSPADMVPSQSASVDPHYQPHSASTSWHSPATSQPMSAYPATPVNVPQGYYSNGLVNQATRTGSVNRPQTSDGLPSYPSHLPGGGVALPSARSIVSNMSGGYSSGGVSVSPTYSTGGQMMTGYPTGRYGSYDQNAGRYVSMQSGDSDLQFVTLPGGSMPPRKRSRRRYDEIERIYHCEWKGCDKAYGTLNHLNAHVAMQKHGEKRLPVQFKEMRKEWRRKKREEATEAANKELQAHAAAAQHAAAHQAAASHHHSAVDPQSAGGYHWSDGRHATADPASLYSSYSTSSSNSLGVDSDPYGHRDSTTNTISSGGSPNDGRFAYSNGSWSSVYDRKGSMGITTPQSATASSTFNLYGMNHHSIV